MSAATVLAARTGAEAALTAQRKTLMQRGTVQGVDTATGKVWVRLAVQTADPNPDPPKILMPCIGIVPEQGERVWVQHFPPAGWYCFGTALDRSEFSGGGSGGPVHHDDSTYIALTGDGTPGTPLLATLDVTALTTALDGTFASDADVTDALDYVDTTFMPFSGGTFTGSVNFGTHVVHGVDTPVASDDAAPKGYVDAAVAGLVNSAPGTLDTLKELADALGDDPNFSATITALIGTKADDSAVVKLTGNQTVAGIKTFSSAPIMSGASISAGTIPLASMATVADQRLVGNVSGGAASAIALTAAQVSTFLSLGSLATLSAVDSAHITDGTIVAADLSATAAVALTQLAAQADLTFLGNVSGGSHTPVALTATQTLDGLGEKVLRAGVRTIPDTSTAGFVGIDFYPEYGYAGGSTYAGGNAASESLTLSSTSAGVKGFIYFGASGAYDEANGRLGVGTLTPASTFVVQGAAGAPAIMDGYRIDAASAALAIGEVALAVRGFGWDGSAYGLLGTLNFLAGDAFTGSHHGAYAQISTVDHNTTTNTTRMRWDYDGSVQIPGQVQIGQAVGTLPTVALDVTGAGKFSSTLAVTGHVTFEGVTSTGATGTGKLVFDTAPTFASTMHLVGAGTFDSTLDVAGTITGSAATQFISQSTAAAPIYDGQRINAASGQVVATNVILTLRAKGWDSTNSVYRVGGSFTITANETFNAQAGSYASVNTVAPGGTTNTERARFQSDGVQFLPGISVGRTLGTAPLTGAGLDCTGVLVLRPFTMTVTAGTNSDVAMSGSLARIAISGGAGAFTIDSIANNGEGFLILLNPTGQNMTLKNNSGGTAANRISTDTGADLVTTGSGSVILAYDSSNSRWRVVASNL